MDRAMNQIRVCARSIPLWVCEQEHPGQCRRSKGPAQSGTRIIATQVARSHHLQSVKANDQLCPNGLAAMPGP